MVKNKYLFFFVFLFIFLFFNLEIVLALEVTDYPSVPGVSAPSNCTGTLQCLPQLIGYLSGLGVYIAGAIAAISFALGAVGYIVSSDNPEMRSNAKDRMKGSALGLILLVSAFVILKTINPALVTESPIPPLPGLPGVYYSDDTPAPASASSVPTDKSGIKYVCDNNQGPVLIIWFFPEQNFGNYENATIQRINCGGQTGISGDSFKMAFQAAGVYFFLGQGCSGYMSEVNTASQDEISGLFKNKVKSVRMVNDATKGVFYGAIFHKEAGLKNAGECEFPIISTGNESCGDINIGASAVDILKINKNSASSGTGASFFSAPYGWDVGARAGFYDISPSKINADTNDLIKNPDEMRFSYENINKAYRPDEYRSACVTFKNCPGSMQLKGSYLAAFYNKKINAEEEEFFNFYGEPLICQTFTKNIPNFKVQPFMASGIAELKSIYIIPTIR